MAIGGVCVLCLFVGDGLTSAEFAAISRPATSVLSHLLLHFWGVLGVFVSKLHRCFLSVPVQGLPHCVASMEVLDSAAQKTKT